MIDGGCPNITPERVELAKRGLFTLITLASLIASPWAIKGLIKDFRKWRRRHE